MTDENTISPVYQAYQDHQVALKRFLRRYFTNAQDIEDAAQEAFLRAFAAEARSTVKSPKSFLFEIAKNFALNELQRKSKIAADSIADFDGSPVLRDEQQVGADEQIDARRKLAAFSEAVAQLPPQCRRVFMMRKFDGLRIKEIAARLNITVSSVEKHIATGLLKCGEHLTARGYDPSEYLRRTRPSSRTPNVKSVNMPLTTKED